MATPGILISEMASALGLTVATVTQFDRVLSEAGLRSKKGRGRSASQVTPADAAKLFISILGSPLSGFSIFHAAITCETYGNLRPRVQASWPEHISQLGLRTLAALPNDHTLLDAVTALFEGAARGEYIKVPGSGRMERKDLYWANGLLSLTLSGPIPWAEIYVQDHISKHGREARIVYSPLEEAIASGALHQTRHTNFSPMVRLRALFQERPAKKEDPAAANYRTGKQGAD